MIARVYNSTEKSANRINFVVRFFVALKAAKTFAIVVAVLTICILTPTVVGWILNAFYSARFQQIWFVVFSYEFNGINSVVNAFIYGMRHVKYRKAYVHIIFKLFSCRGTNQQDDLHVVRFFVALKAAKTFAIVVTVLTFCVLTPTVVGPILREVCTVPSRQFWFVILNYEFNSINSIVNALIYGTRHVKYRKAYLHIIFKLFSCREANK